MQLVFTEQGTAWVPDFLGQLDYFFDRMRNAEGSQEREWGLPVVEKLSLVHDLCVAAATATKAAEGATLQGSV